MVEKILAGIANKIFGKVMPTLQANMPEIEVSQILQELSQQISSNNISRRIQICHRGLDLLALKQFQFLQFDQYRAILQGELGNCLLHTTPYQTEYIEEAITAFTKAIEMGRETMAPKRWAVILMLRAEAYRNRRPIYQEENDMVWISKEGAEDLENALNDYRQALEVFTPNDVPEWIHAAQNLAKAYILRGNGGSKNNLKKALKLSLQILHVITKDSMPFEWAITQSILATIYVELSKNQEDLITKILEHYYQALEVYTLEQFPHNYQLTYQKIGHLHFSRQNWQEAKKAFLCACDANCFLLKTLSTDTRRDFIVKQTVQLYSELAYCLIKLEEPEESLRLLEQGKTRVLTQFLSSNEFEGTKLSMQQRITVKELQNKIHTIEEKLEFPVKIRTFRAKNYLQQIEILAHTRSELRQTIDSIQHQHPNFMRTEIDLDEIFAIIPEHGAIVAPLITAQGSIVFVVPHYAETITNENVIWLDDFTDETLNKLLGGSDEEPGWLSGYFKYREHLNKRVETETVDTIWQTKIHKFTAQLWDVFMRAVHHKLSAFNVEQHASILLMPQNRLGCLPLHAAWRDVDGVERTFLDDYQVSYVASAYTHNVSQRRLQKQQRQERSLFTIYNSDLTYAQIESELIANFFDSKEILVGDKTTLLEILKALAKKSYLHFACHGTYNWVHVLLSELKFADQRYLTLADILSKLELTNHRLITLSACETGLTDVIRAPDEYIGLPSGFIQAGVPAVISTLWTVDDLSTMLLMERFYQNHLQKGMLIAEALRQAQLWLRGVTAAELGERFSEERKAILGYTRMSATVVSAQYRRFTDKKNFQPQDRPFANPYYWAAFTFNGV